MISLEINSFAKALFDLGVETAKITTFYNNAILVKKVLQTNDDLLKFLKNRRIDSAEKHIFLNNVFTQSVDSLFLNFLKLLVDKNFSHHLEAILETFINIYYESENILHGVVYSTNQLDLKVMNALEEKMTQKFGQKVILKNKIDPKLIAGIKIKINDFVYEDSINSRLKQIGEKILRGDN
ncbi:F0F1 ATP synthase subunit delta [Candidatus Mycoplasma pogonae]